MAELHFVEEWPMQGRERTFVGEVTIGRTDCDVLLPDPDVSRRHAVVRSVAEGFAVEDLDSTNGTYVNDERITTAVEVHEGDRVRFGNTVWRVHSRGGAAATRVAAMPSDNSRPQAAEEPTGESERMPSAIRRVLPADHAASVQSPFEPPASHAHRGSAARRIEATVASYAVVAATAVAVTVYLIQR